MSYTPIGHNRAYAKDDSRTTTTAAAYGGVGTLKLTLATGTIAGKFMVNFCGALDMGGANQVGYIRFRDDTAGTDLAEYATRPSATTEIQSFCFMGEVTLDGAASHNIVIQFRSGVAGNTTGCRLAGIEMWRVN